MVLQEKDFADALQQGNMAVFEQVFRGYYERLCNYANTILNDMDEAEEIVQGTFLGLWEKRGQIRIHTALKSYLYQAVHNSCLNHLDHLKVRKAHREYFIRSTEEASETGAQTTLVRELEVQIEEAISALPPQCQHVFRLSRFEGLTYAEIAQQLNISVKTIENHMGKALRILREQLKDYLPLLLWFLFREN
ncbi:MAG: RNA polymerase sigma-70 factor [Bacteroidetes bacterium]|nr:RNA polymerase sigma-70 factor [Bacteroidota bacterium]